MHGLYTRRMRGTRPTPPTRQRSCPLHRRLQGIQKIPCARAQVLELHLRQHLVPAQTQGPERDGRPTPVVEALRDDIVRGPHVLEKPQIFCVLRFCLMSHDFGSLLIDPAAKSRKHLVMDAPQVFPVALCKIRHRHAPVFRIRRSAPHVEQTRKQALPGQTRWRQPFRFSDENRQAFIRLRHRLPGRASKRNRRFSAATAATNSALLIDSVNGAIAAQDDWWLHQTLHADGSQWGHRRDSSDRR